MSQRASNSAAPPASTKRPPPSLQASSSAAPPASKRSKLSTSGSAAQPATLLEQVTDKERAENSLATQISKQWSSLDDATRIATRLQQPASAEQPATSSRTSSLSMQKYTHGCPPGCPGCTHGAVGHCTECGWTWIHCRERRHYLDGRRARSRSRSSSRTSSSSMQKPEHAAIGHCTECGLTCMHCWECRYNLD